MRQQRGVSLPAWPDWCFLPLHGAYAIVSGGGSRVVPLERMHHVGILGALAAWRVTQGVYRFDPALYSELIDTPLPPELPRAPLYRLPEWCVYVETPDTHIDMRDGAQPRRLYGVWAHLDWNEPTPHDESGDELRLVLDMARTPEDALSPFHGCIPLPLILGDGTITDALNRVVASGAARARALGIDPPADDSVVAGVARQLWPIISLLLYLCADDCDFGADGARPTNPAPRKTQRGWRAFPPDQARTWNVGTRLGAALRAAYQRIETQKDQAGGSDHRARPRPHIRRAHWHTYLVGEGRAARRVRWLPPVPVALDDVTLLPTTIRPVTATPGPRRPGD